VEGSWNTTGMIREEASTCRGVYRRGDVIMSKQSLSMFKQGSVVYVTSCGRSAHFIGMAPTSPIYAEVLFQGTQTPMAVRADTIRADTPSEDMQPLTIHAFRKDEIVMVKKGVNDTHVDYAYFVEKSSERNSLVWTTKHGYMVFLVVFNYQLLPVV
jgi:hypothetical protein